MQVLTTNLTGKLFIPAAYRLRTSGIFMFKIAGNNLFINLLQTSECCSILELLYIHFRKFISLTPEEESVAGGFFRYKKYRKHQYILQEGDVCRHESFILSGCTRTYRLDEKGQEHILQFGMQNWWVGDLRSFLSDQPSQQNIDCLEETELLQISKTGLEELYRGVPKTERYFRILIQNAYLSAMNRISSNLSRTALQRYQEFMLLYPDIEQRIANHQVASFLGITPQSLSRIRNRQQQKKK